MDDLAALPQTSSGSLPPLDEASWLDDGLGMDEVTQAVLKAREARERLAAAAAAEAEAAALAAGRQVRAMRAHTWQCWPTILCPHHRLYDAKCTLIAEYPVLFLSFLLLCRQ